jgi:archaellum biogenesis ATPase FlaH
MEADMAGNHNLFVEKFLTIYSQSELSTAGTRGYDPQTYVDTKLDLKLTPRIYSPETRLVVLTGNAGDGKTAYIQRLEAMAKDQGATFSAQTDNGCIFKMNEISYQTLYDGSQDFEGAKNDQILKTFFSDLEGAAEPQGSFTKIIAIKKESEGQAIVIKYFSFLIASLKDPFLQSSFQP